MEGNEVPKTETHAGMPMRSKGTLTPARNAVFSLTLASFGNYCLLSVGLLLILWTRIRVSAAGHFLILAMGIGAIPLVTACNFYFKDGKKRFASPVWKWYSGVVGVVAIVLAFQLLGVRAVPFAVRGIAALGILWIACAVLLPLPQFVERLRAKDWKTAAAAVWCAVVMGILLCGMVAGLNGSFGCGALLAAGAGLWFTGYLTRAYWYANLEGLPFRKVFHYFCWPLWIGAVLIYGFNLWIALPKYESRIAPARAAAAKKFGHAIDRKEWESAYSGSGVRGDELLMAFVQTETSADFQKSLVFRLSFEKAPDLSRENGVQVRQETGKDGVAAPVMKAEEAILAVLPIRNTLGPGLLKTQSTARGILAEISRHRLLLGNLALRAKEFPETLRHLSELEALTNSVATEPVLASQMTALTIGNLTLDLAEAAAKTEGITPAQKGEIAKIANRLALTLAKSNKMGWYGETVSFDEIMNTMRHDLPPYNMRYTLPQFAVVAAKGHGNGLRRFARHPYPPDANPAEFMWNLFTPDLAAARTELLNFCARAKMLK